MLIGRLLVVAGSLALLAGLLLSLSLRPLLFLTLLSLLAPPAGAVQLILLRYLQECNLETNYVSI